MYRFFHIPIVFLIAFQKKFLDSYYCSDIRIDINEIELDNDVINHVQCTPLWPNESNKYTFTAVNSSIEVI